MQGHWYYRTRQGTVGPLTDDEFSAKLSDGVLNAGSLVRHGVAGRFRPLKEAVAMASAQASGSSEVAARVLAQLNRVVVTGEATVVTRSSLWHSLLESLGGIGILLGRFARLIFWPVTATWELLHEYVGRRTVAALLLVTAVLVFLRNIPTLDPPLSDTHRELSSIWADASSLRVEPVDASALDEFRTASLPRLDQIAGTLERSHERRLGYGLWAMLQGRDEATEKARLDLLRVAKYDFPAFLSTPQEADLRGPQITKQLDRVEEHLAAAGKSPYVTPEPFKRLTAAPVAVESESSPEDSADKRWVSAIVAVDALLLIAGGLYWWRRR